MPFRDNDKRRALIRRAVRAVINVARRRKSNCMQISTCKRITWIHHSICQECLQPIHNRWQVRAGAAKDKGARLACRWQCTSGIRDVIHTVKPRVQVTDGTQSNSLPPTIHWRSSSWSCAERKQQSGGTGERFVFFLMTSSEGEWTLSFTRRESYILGTQSVRYQATASESEWLNQIKFHLQIQFVSKCFTLPLDALHS